MKILLVDDSGTMRRIQSNVLKDLGFKDIIEASDGNEGFEFFKSISPDLVITDWNMPVMNGLELVRAIRGIDTRSPIIMVTTESEKVKVVEAVQAGVNDYLIKPFRPEQLSAKIARLTRGSVVSS